MNIVIRKLGIKDYKSVWNIMSGHTLCRIRNSQDELWVTEHPPVYTLGKAGKAEHILDAEKIPIVKSDRGGQVTYHGPGQVVVYTLLDVKRLEIGPRELVRRIEGGIIRYLASIGIQSLRKERAPGVYVKGSKVAALGLRIRNGFSYHGLAINVNMDLKPYLGINPCGYKGQVVSQLSDILGSIDTDKVISKFLPFLCSEIYQDKVYSIVEKVDWDGLPTKGMI